MDRGLLQGSWKIGSVMGIPLRVHFSWLIVFGLIAWSLSTYYFPLAAPDLPAVSYWIKGVLAALLLFLSVALHELAHSFVARSYGISIQGITLFIFGGVAQLKGEPPHPRAEFTIAIVGPLTSFLLSLIFFLFALTTHEGTRALFDYLSRINLTLGIFNLIPGFPMDGGRVLRALLWKRRNDYLYATKKAAGAGQKIALAFVFLGLLAALFGVAGGLWMMLIGWFLYTAAQASYQQATLQQALAGVRVEDIMVTDLVTLDASVPVAEAVDGSFLRFGYGGFPVLKNGAFLGIVTLKEVKEVPRQDWERVRVGEIAVPRDRKWEATPEDEVMKALELMVQEDKGRLAVTEGGQLIGLITRSGIARYLQIMGRGSGP